MLKKLAAAFLCATLCASSLFSCSKRLEVDVDESSGESERSSTLPETTAAFLENGKIDISRFSDRRTPAIDPESSIVKNFSSPKIGDTVVVIKLRDYDGEIKIRLFPEYASKGVENFVGLANKGYYDGTVLYRVLRDCMLLGGDPEGDGSGGESLWGGYFDGGADPNLVNAAGAVGYANNGATSSDGSQFYIVTGVLSDGTQFADDYPDDVKEIYTAAGGAPWLDGTSTVFGQIYQGLDIVFSAQDVRLNGAGGQEYRPVEDIVAEYVKTEEYNGEELKWFVADYR